MRGGREGERDLPAMARREEAQRGSPWMQWVLGGEKEEEEEEEEEESIACH